MKNEVFMNSNFVTITKDNFGIELTQKAQSMAQRACSLEEGENLFLRVSIKGGGCAGLKYNLDIDDQMTNFDVLCDYDGLKVVSDIFSLEYLKNINIDYQETLEGAGFKFNNPNARRSCGCGSSFAA